MKACIAGESPADEAAVRILLEGLLRAPVELVPPGPRVRAGGWSSLLGRLPTFVRHLHYRTDADALVVVVDSDESPIHEAASATSPCAPKCRLCGLRGALATTRTKLKDTPGRTHPLRVAFGLAVPAIEAWYRCGADPHVSEAAWIQARSRPGERPLYDKPALKRAVYGTDRPDLALETRRAVEEATRLASSLDALRQWFPAGFGALADEVRGW